MAGLQRQSTSKKKRAEAAMREHSRNKHIALTLVVFLALIAAFALGFAVRSNEPFMASLGFVSGGPNDTEDPSKTKTVYDNISLRVDEVENVLQGYSLDEVNLDQATQSMLADMLKSTNDPYAEYYDPERYSNYIKESAQRRYSGIGVLFGDYNGRAYAIDVFAGSEAAAKGVQQGDFVESVDGDSSHVWTMMEVVGAIADTEEDDNVLITWMRPISLDASTGSEFSTTLQCHHYEQDNVTTDIDDGVGYIRLCQMTANSSTLVGNAIRDLASQGAESYVLDIRSNPGGYLTQALNVASLFVNSGVLVNIETVDGINTRSAAGVVATDAPLVVMVDRYTSSSAEVLAAALADNQRAITIGQTTMGKGSVQVVRDLTFGGAIRYTAAYYKTPLGRQIDGAGVVPEIPVPADDDAETQLNIAMDTARSLARQ